ncbi:hypothetical protein ACFO3O_13590 [Dokdonia ponticola]|uniref:Uncharacterized protein n=1 Tax=Dokdonia ponticola TaxID=2041041 RepID=A0ABV9HYL9_9FLAO
MSLQKITDAHLKRRVFDTSKKDYINNILVDINIYSSENITRNSTHILHIDIWNKKYFSYKSNDSIFSTKGIEISFGNTSLSYKRLLNKDFKYVVTDELEKESESLKSIGTIYDPASSISIYFNKENEITYIDQGQDQIYYELLKDEIKFSNTFIEKLK